MMAAKPPMGWNTWNAFGTEISEALIMEAADVMDALHMKDYGYEYLVIDDAWQAKERNEKGELCADPERFPHGIKWISDYVHSKELKLGIYSCAGSQTCGKYPGSFQHEFQDARTFASWGVDFLKYDNCFKPEGIDDHLLYRRMAMALRNCGRDILFSACSWGEYDTLSWARNAGAHMWRSTADVMDNWESVKGIALSQFENAPYNGPYSFNDMDMLVTGLYGKTHIGIGGCTDVEYQTHFALWALMTSPLFIGCDIRDMNEKTKEILFNRELIDINQDREGRQAYAWKIHQNDGYYGLVKLLSNGDYAFGIFNFTDRDTQEGEINLRFWDMGLPLGYGFQLRDVLKHQDIGIAKEYINVTLKAHECAVFRGSLVEG